MQFFSLQKLSRVICNMLLATFSSTAFNANPLSEPGLAQDRELCMRL